MNNLKKLIDQAEIAREKKQTDKALTLLDKAIWQAGADKQYNLILDALGHKMIIWLHQYQSSGDDCYLELMAAEARAGYMIGTAKKVDKGFLAIMLHRLGNYHYYLEEFKEASAFAKAALTNLNKKEAGRYGEYLAHYGVYSALEGDKKGIAHITEALHMVRQSRDLRTFHKMVVESGILIRLAIAAYAFGDEKFYVSALNEAQGLAKILNQEYKMPGRLDQIKKLKQNPGMLT